MEITLNGRIESVEQVSGASGLFYNTVVAIPAVDMYSRPDQYKLVSDFMPGTKGEEVSLKCNVSSFVKSKPYKDKNTGQNKVFLESNVTFRIVEILRKNQPTAVPKAV